MSDKKETPSRAAAGLRNCVQSDRLNSSEAKLSPSDYQAQYREACRRLERRIDDLDTIGIWKRDIQERIDRAALVFELVDVDVDMDVLAAEVSDFTAVCRALAGREGGA